MKKRYTMSEILTKIKIYDKRIKELTGELASLRNLHPFIYTAKSGQDTVNGVSIATLESEMKSQYTSMIELVKNYETLVTIKDDVNNSIHVTMYGKTYSVSQLLALSAPAVKKIKTSLIQNLTNQSIKAKAAIAKYEETMYTREKINDYITVSLGNGAQDALKDPKRMAELEKQYKEITKMVLIDPIDIDKEIDALQNEYDRFYNQLAYKIQQVNALTMVDIDLDTGEWELINKDQVEKLDMDTNKDE